MISRFFTIFLIGFLGISQEVKSDQFADQKTQSTNMVNLIENTKAIVKMIPGGAAQALQTYLEVTKPQQAYSSDIMIGGANFGVISYFRDQLSGNSYASKCFYAKAELFYDYIAKNSHELSSKALPGRVSLDDNIDQSAHTSGWIWRKAMQISNNDANEAMSLIGICGHDESPAMHPFGERRLSSDDAKSISPRYSIPNADCPERTTEFFLPGALDKSADISKELKKKIATIQAPNLGARVIPAKYYHVYYGAYMACKMIQNGVSNKAATDYPPKFAGFYRRIRLCGASQFKKKSIDALNDDYQIYFRSEVSAGKDPLSLAKYLTSKGTDNCNKMLSKVGLQINCFDEEHLSKNLVSAFASKMFYEQQNCPTSTAGNISEAMRAFSSTPKTAFTAGKEFNCDNIPVAYCEPAKKVLGTWEVDFEWTMEQQLAGAKFAATNCKPLDKKLNIENKCEIPNAFFAEDPTVSTVLEVKPSRTSR